MLIGTVEQFPSKADAERAVERLRSQINAPNPQPPTHVVTVDGLIDRFLVEYAPRHCRKPTQRVYQSLFTTHVRPKWGGKLVQNVKTMAVEDWLADYPHSRQIKSHVRNLMHTLSQAAIRWEIVEKNPIDLVRQSRKRLKTPTALTPAEFRSLLDNLSEPHRSMVITDACLGLRVSELLGLRWGNIDFENLTVKVQRSFVEGNIDSTENDVSEDTLPLAPALATMLLQHKGRAVYTNQDDYVFAGATGKPRWPDSLRADYLHPAAAKAGISKKIGWHTFRHAYSTLLHSLGAAPAVQKELLRHADIQTTMNIYTQAVPADKREAALRVTETLWKM